jgi:lysophospholipase L1-like esterase
MIGRLQEMLHDNRHKNPSLIIILGGTNDLGTLPSDSIYENIQKIHLLALKSSLLTERPIYTIAVTIPQLTWGGENSNLKRLNVNENIRKLVKRCNKYIFLFDMESLFDQKNEAYKIYWSPDQVHFSPLGYDKIGELLYDLITSVKIPDDSVDLKETIKTCHLTEVS